MAERPEYLFVINASAGRDDGAARLDAVRAFVKRSQQQQGIYEIPEPFSFERIKRHILSENPRKLIAMGGDGTVNICATAIIGTDIVLGIVPAGSANGMAKELEIPQDIAENLALLESGTSAPVDLIQINGSRYCIHLSDIGINARLIKHFDKARWRGKLGYASVAVKTLWQHKKIMVAVTTAEGKVTREAFMVAIANARTYGTGAVINPDGDISDGKFELIIVRRLSLLSVLKTLFNPVRHNPKHFEVISCASAEITMRRPMHFQVDGEYCGKESVVKAEIMPSAIRMIGKKNPDDSQRD